MKLSGRISDFIRSGKLPKNVQVTGPRVPADDRPSIKSVRRASGQGLGSGAERRRNGGAE